MAKVLLVDESITIQKVVDLVLSEEGHEVKSVRTGDEALSEIPAFMPDVVMADVKVQGVNGYELASKIKSTPATSRIPVLLLTGAFEPFDEAMLRKSGADSTLVKPFESADLVGKIQSLTSGGAVAEAATAVPEEVDIMFEGEEEFEATPFEEEAFEAEEEEAMSEEELWDLGLDEEAEPLEAVEEVTVEEAAVQPAQEIPAAAATVDIPSKEELTAVFKKAIEEQLAGLDLKAALAGSISPAVGEAIEKTLLENAPRILEQVLKDKLAETLAAVNKVLEEVIWETVPEMAESIIKEEIEKIRSTS